MRARKMVTVLRCMLVVVLTLAGVGIIPASAGPLPPFSGGPVSGDYPLLVPNDHTPVAVRFTGSGLATSTTYYVKVRMSPNPTPTGGENRGYTYNRTTGKWVYVGIDADWSTLPTVTTDAAGNIVAANDANWAWFKFGDETKSGPYYIIISLSKDGTAGGTTNCDTPALVNVVDMKTSGSWVHNGAAAVSATQAFKRVTLNAETASGSTTQVASITRNEANTIDDDSDGVVDNEDYGLAGSLGDWRLAASADTTMKCYLQTGLKSTFKMGAADQDIALGAADMTAPASPASLVAVAGEKRVDLSWAPATDDTGIALYRVYRWANTSSSSFTPAPQLIGTTTDTAFVDSTTVVGGIDYSYEVRAQDAATNVSARSNTATATSFATPPAVQVAVAGQLGENGWYKGATVPTITLTSSGTALYMWDQSSLTTATGPIAVPEGIHTLTYLGVDGFGNRSNEESLSISYDSAAPNAAASGPAVVSDVATSGAFTVSWQSSDTVAAPLDVYEVEYSTSSGRFLVKTSRPEAKISGLAGQTYGVRVRSYDVAGNVGSWSSVAKCTVPYNQTSMRYSSGWGTALSPSATYGSLKYTYASGASASMAFSGGTKAYLVTSTGPTRGMFKVYMDGRYQRTVNLYSASSKARTKLYLASFGTGAHTLKLVQLSSGSRKRVDIDGLAIIR